MTVETVGVCNVRCSLQWLGVVSRVTRADILTGVAVGVAGVRYQGTRCGNWFVVWVTIDQVLLLKVEVWWGL